MTEKTNPPPAPPETVDMVRVNVQVTAKEHQELKIYAATHKTTISELMRNFIKVLLAKKD